MSKKRKKNKGGKPSNNTNTVKRLKDELRSVFAHNLGERFSYRQLIKELKHDVLDELGEEVINQLIGIDEINAKDKPIQCVQTDAKIIGNFSSKPCSFIIVNR